MVSNQLLTASGKLIGVQVGDPTGGHTSRAILEDHKSPEGVENQLTRPENLNCSHTGLRDDITDFPGKLAEMQTPYLSEDPACG